MQETSFKSSVWKSFFWKAMMSFACGQNRWTKKCFHNFGGEILGKEARKNAMITFRGILGELGSDDWRWKA